VRFRHKLAILVSIFIAGWMLATIVLHSEGPELVGGPSTPSTEGQPYKWGGTTLAFSGMTLNYWTDQGSLGSVSNPDDLVSTAFQAWQNVATANINFKRQGQLGADVTSTNVLGVLNSLENCGTLPAAPAGGIAKPVTIIYDTDGTLFTALGYDPNTTGGVATALCPTSDGTNNLYNRGEAILNGKDSSQAQLTAIMVHEFGHMIGLDHSQVNLDCLNKTSACISDGSIAGVPIMFPVLIDNKTNPAPDDVAGLSVLYPETANNSPTQIPFSAMGEIQGRVFFADGVTPAQGFNVIARSVANPRTVAVSNVSGFLFTEDVGDVAIPGSLQDEPYFSHDQALIGYYDIPGLPPGDYTLEVESINNAGQFPFVGGSSLGPIGKAGFQFALPGSCLVHQFFTDPAPGNDPCNTGTTVSVLALGTSGITAGKDIILIGTGPRYDAWEDGP
jgi:Matrixin